MIARGAKNHIFARGGVLLGGNLLTGSKTGGVLAPRER
jgi:hypothetical protein